jgi:hypothetical protein
MVTDSDVDSPDAGGLQMLSPSEGTFTLGEHCWTVTRRGRHARAAAAAMAPMTAEMTRLWRARWTLSIDHQQYTLRTRHWYGGGWAVLDATGCQVATVPNEAGGTSVVPTGGGLPLPARMFVLFVVASSRGDGDGAAAGRHAASVKGRVAYGEPQSSFWARWRATSSSQLSPSVRWLVAGVVALIGVFFAALAADPTAQVGIWPRVAVGAGALLMFACAVVAGPAYSHVQTLMHRRRLSGDR